ncbi:MAG TPA: hypothetical protein VEW42_02240 [Candidatus Eisenbacteria bacterium]|nr:hypothetical protein [Candidatus Eisenbacteria bacterium]
MGRQKIDLFLIESFVAGRDVVKLTDLEWYLSENGVQASRDGVRRCYLSNMRKRGWPEIMSQKQSRDTTLSRRQQAFDYQVLRARKSRIKTVRDIATEKKRGIRTVQKSTRRLREAGWLDEFRVYDRTDTERLHREVIRRASAGESAKEIGPDVGYSVRQTRDIIANHKAAQDPLRMVNRRESSRDHRRPRGKK